MEESGGAGSGEIRVMRKIEDVAARLLATSHEEAEEEPQLQCAGDPRGSLELGLSNCTAFGRVIVALGQVYQLLGSGAFATKRELYYRAKAAYGEGGQSGCDRAISAVCELLQEPREALHLMATAKGLVAGDLAWRNARTGQSASAVHAAQLIPGRVSEMRELRSSARLVLVVEKDAVFQSLLDDGFLRLFHPAILLTGKGYPDVASRALLRRIVVELGIPAFVLVDADVHGLEIAATYKFGPRKATAEVGELSIPSLQLVGLKRSETDRLPLGPGQYLRMKDAEFRKVEALKSRPDIAEDAVLLGELSLLGVAGSKVETEALATLAPDYLTRVFLPDRLPAFLAGCGPKETPQFWDDDHESLPMSAEQLWDEVRYSVMQVESAQYDAFGRVP